MTSAALKSLVAGNLAKNGFSLDAYGRDRGNVEKALEAMGQDEGCGLVVSGSVGCGKSTLCDAVAGLDRWWWVRRMTTEEGRTWFEKNGASLREVAGRRQGEEWAEMPKSVYLDDVGQDVPVNTFGVKTDPLGDFVVALGEAYRTGRWRRRLVATTNLDMQGLAARYGVRMADRLSEMCVILYLRGGSLRRVRGVIGGRA